MLTDRDHQSFIAHGPLNSKYRDVVLRLVAMRMRHAPEGLWKLSVQVHGFPVQSITHDLLTKQDIQSYLDTSVSEGWSIEVDPVQEIIDKKNQELREANAAYLKAYKAIK